MASEHPRDQDSQVPLREGEFHRIPGIGPGIEQRLHAAGIRTFDHLASLTPDEICTMLNGMVGMTPERVSNQDWPGKANLLAQALREEKITGEPDEPGERQHYTSFMVELLQDDEQTVRRTRVVHVQAGSKDSWAGWDARRLVKWLQDRSGMALPQEPAPAEPAARGEVADRSELADQSEPAARSEPAIASTGAQPASRSRPQRAHGPVEVLFAGVIDPHSQQTGRFLYTGSPVQMRLSLDMRKTALPTGTRLAYNVLVEARGVGSTGRTPLAEASGEHVMQDEIMLSIPLQGLTEGTYHLSVSAQLSPVGDPRPDRDSLRVFTDGGIIHVFSEESALAG